MWAQGPPRGPTVTRRRWASRSFVQKRCSNVCAALRKPCETPGHAGRIGRSVTPIAQGRRTICSVLHARLTRRVALTSCVRPTTARRHCRKLERARLRLAAASRSDMEQPTYLLTVAEPSNTCRTLPTAYQREAGSMHRCWRPHSIVRFEQR